MKIAANLNIVTHREGRSCMNATGYAEISEYASFGFETSDCSIRVELDSDGATVTRTGQDGYMLRLEENKFTAVNLAGLEVKVFTKKLLCKIRHGRIDFMTEYYMGSPDNSTKIIIKVFYA